MSEPLTLEKVISHIKRVGRSLAQAKKLRASVLIRFYKLKWNLASFAIASSAEIFAGAFRCVRRFYQLAHPLSGSHFGQFVLTALFELGFKLCLTSLRLYGLHSQLLHLHFQRMRCLYLSECGV